MTSLYYDPKSLSSVLSLQTDAPFPRPRLSDSAEPKPQSPTLSDVLPTPTYDPSDEKIELQVCSEFTNYTAPITAFESSSKLALFTDGDGQPVLCSIGDDKHLYLLYHVDGCAQAWQITDITPPTAIDGVDAFDMVSWDRKVFFATARRLPNGGSVLDTCVIDIPKFTATEDSKSVTPNPKDLIRWREIANNLGDKAVTYLRCAPAVAPLVESDVYQIVAGTESFGQNAASEYVIDPSINSLNPWVYLPLPETTWKVLEIDGANTNSGSGVFTLYKGPDSTGCTQSVIDSSGKWVQPLGNIRLLTDAIGSVNSMGINANPALQTDVFLAGDKGIGFYQANRLTKPPQVILPDISFKQVASHEDLDPANPTAQSLITVFGVSQQDELYFISGTRKFARNQVSFGYSGLPIRTNVARLSCFYNGAVGTTEVVYAIDNDNKIRHLRRDAQGDTWTESTISVPSIGKSRTFPAYISSITCTDSIGNAVYEGYPLSFTCDAVNVLANNKTYNLNTVPTIIPTDSSGRVRIVMETDTNLAAPTMTVGLTKFRSTPDQHSIYPHQRVLTALSTVQNGDQLRAAQTAKGAPVFPADTSSDIQRNKQDVCGSVLGNFKNMVNAADPVAANQFLNQSANNGPADFAMTVEKDDAGQLSTSSDTNWVDQVFSTVKKFVSDVMEWFKSAAKKVFRFAFRVIAGALEFVVQIAGKVIKVVLKSVGHVLNSLVGFLKEHLGIDLTGLMAWLAFIFDVDEIKKTQQVLLNVAHGGLNLTERFLDLNRSTLKDIIETLRTFLKQHGIKDTRPAKPTLEGLKDKGSKVFNMLMNNPLAHSLQQLSPLNTFFDIIGEAAMEEILDLIKLPNLDNLRAIVSDIIPNLIEDEIKILLQMVEDVYEKVKSVLSDPGQAGEIIVAMMMDIFWTIFDASETLMMAIYDIVVRLLKQFFVTITSVIKIPVLTSFFEIFAEQDFSIVNCITFISAGLMNIVYSVEYGKRPFEVLDDPSGFFDHIDDSLLDLHGALSLQRTASTDTTGIMNVKPMALVSSRGTGRTNSKVIKVNGVPVGKTVDANMEHSGVRFPPALGKVTMNGVFSIRAAVVAVPDDDYKNAQKIYTIGGGAAAVVAGLGKAVATVLPKLLQAAKNDKMKPQEGAKDPKTGEVIKDADGRALDEILTIISTVPFMTSQIIGVVASIVDFTTYSVAVQMSKDYANKLGSPNIRIQAYVVNILFSAMGVLVTGVNLQFKRPELQALAASIPLMGDMVYQGVNNIECATDDNTINAAGIRIGLADGLGILSNGLTLRDVPFPAQVVGYACSATSLLGAGIAAGMTRLNPT